MIRMNTSNPLQDRMESPEKEFQVLKEFISSKNIQMDYMHILKENLFSERINKTIFQIAKNLMENDKDLNESAVRSFIKMNYNKMKVSQLDDHMDILMSYNAMDTFSNIVSDLDIMRKNRILVEEIINAAKSKFINNEPIENIIKDITESIISMDSDNEEEKSYDDHVENVVENIENPGKNKDYIKLRLEGWNEIYNGLIKDRMYAIAGESGAGKTAFCCEIISEVCEDHQDDVAVLFYSYEMSQNRIITRLISRKIMFTESKLAQRVKRLTDEELNLVRKAAMEIKNYPLEIVYKTLSDRELKMRTRRFALKNKGKHLIIFLDHMGLVDGDENDMRIKTIKTSKNLKSFATDYQASVFALSQLKKELADENNPTNRKNYHKPNDSHVMESGAVKADCDALILLWRPDMRFDYMIYDGHEKWDCRGKLILLNCKNRDGQSPTDIVVGCDIKYNYLYNLKDPFSPVMTPLIAEEIKQRDEFNQGFNIDSSIEFP
jgi:replicative DNA helicase